MAVSAGNPQLKLQVSLDLTFLRTQLSGLGRTIGDVPFSVVPKLDTRQLVKDIGKLQKEIKININDTQLQSLSQRIETAQTKLQGLKNETIVIGVTGQASVSQAEARTIRAGLTQAILGERGKIRVPVSIRPAITQVDVATFKREVRSKLSDITVKVKADVQGGEFTKASSFAQSPHGTKGLMDFMRQEGMIGKTASGMTMQMVDPENIKRSLENVRQKADKLAADLNAMGEAAQKTGKASIEESGKILRPQNYGLKIASLTSDIEKLGGEIRKASVKTGTELLRGLEDLSASLLSSTNSFVKIAGTGSTLDDTLRRFDNASKQASAAVNSYADKIRRRAGIPVELGAGRTVLPGREAGGALARIQAPQSFDFQRIEEVKIRNAFDIVRDFNAQRLQAETREFGRALAEALQQARREINAARVRLTGVRELPGRTMALSGTNVAGMLPPAIGMSARESRIAQAYQRSDARGLAVMAAGGGGGMPPALPPGVGRTPSPYGGGGQDAFAFRRAPDLPSGPPPATRLPAGYHDVNKLTKGLGDADKYLRQARVPLAGAITDLGNQFGYAIKQVLLFGTAYKGLAFFMDLPRQAFDATKSLQLFENQINILTGSASEANQAFNFIDNLVERFNIPLQSAREGFAQLYASMSPAGIPIGEVENLFEGMSTAAATLGMSSAEMDRMTLAFSQMASKGKIMTEEVTRQLGDVLPGALAKMAQAAQMEIPEFIDAMQKGQLSGEAMSAVLFNMGIILKRDFGEGASNAANLLRGAMVEIQNSVQRMYEAFRPIVEDLAAQAIPTLSQAVQDVTKGVQAFAASFTKTDTPMAQLSGTAQTVFNTLKSLEEVFKAIGNTVKGIAPAFALLGQSLLLVLEQLARFINTPVGSFLTNLALRIAIVTAALQLMTKAGLISAISTIIRLVTNLQLLTRWMRISAVAARTLRLALTGLVAGGVLLGIELLVDQLGKAARRMDELRGKTIAATQAIRAMSTTEAIAERRSIESDLRVVQGVLTRHRTQTEAARAQFPGAKFRPSATIEVTPEEQAVLEKRGLARQGLRGGVAQIGEVTGLEMSLEGQIAETRHRQRVIEHEEQAQKQELREVVLQEAEGKDGAKGREPSPYDASQLDFIRQAAEQEKLALERRRQSGLISETQFKLSVAELDLETAKATEVEKLRLARLSIARENLTEQDKFNKLKDAEIYKENALAIAKDQHFVATQAIVKELAGPFDRAIEENTDQILEQSMLLNNIKQGRGELSLEEKALLEVRKMLNLLTEDEQALMRENIALAEQSTLERLQAVEAGERELELLNLRNRAELALILDPIANRRRELEQQGFEGEDLSKRLTQELETERLERLGEQLRGIASSIGDAFGNAFKSIVTGTSSVQEALAGMFRSIADSFANMVGEIISQWMRTQVLQGLSSIFGSIGGGGINLGDVGKYSAPLGDVPKITDFPLISSANGNVLQGGFQAFANGGIVKGPTLGLVGEGRYNEAVVPLPDGRKIPVDLGGSSGGDIATSIVVNVSNGQSSSETSGTQGNQLARELEGAVKQVILKETRPGGIIFSQR